MNEQILNILIENFNTIIGSLSTAFILYIQRHFEKKKLKDQYKKEIENLLQQNKTK